MKNKAVFLDRDGVINRERGEYTYRLSDFQFNPGVFETLAFWQNAGYLLIIVSNQGGISKGIYTISEVETLHDHMVGEFARRGIHIAEVYFCPHHSDLEKCLCRKPGTLMIEKALARFSIAPELSYFIGDHERDTMAAEKAGLISIRISPNQSLDTIRKFVRVL